MMAANLSISNVLVLDIELNVVQPESDDPIITLARIARASREAQSDGQQHEAACVRGLRR